MKSTTKNIDQNSYKRHSEVSLSITLKASQMYVYGRAVLLYYIILYMWCCYCVHYLYASNVQTPSWFSPKGTNKLFNAVCLLY